MSINPFCEIAVEEAVRLKEKGTVSEIIVVSIGPKEAQEQIRSSMALGADRGILVETTDEIGALEVAKILKGVVDQEKVRSIRTTSPLSPPSRNSAAPNRRSTMKYGERKR